MKYVMIRQPLDVVSNQMMRALDRLERYKKRPNHSLHEHIGVMYNKMWTFHVRFNEHNELAM